MVAYNFKKQFSEAVASGSKRQTIRASRKTRHCRPDEPIQLYTGMRSKACRKLVNPDPICESITEIKISNDSVALLEYEWDVYLQDSTFQWLVQPSAIANELAISDGFEDLEGLLAFFRETHGLPFEGVLIKWSLPQNKEQAKH